MKRLATAALFLLAAAPASAAPPPASAWEIGPVINGANYSRGVPASPAQGRGGAVHIDLPRQDGVHYVTYRHGPLTGKKRIVLRYRVDMAPGVTIEPSTSPGSPSILTLYFQRAGDNWSGRRRFETYRWYATFASQTPIVAGEFTVSAPLDGAWTAVMSSTARTNPRGFADAKDNAERVGFVLGGGDGYGHGVYATGRARLTVLDFRVE